MSWSQAHGEAYAGRTGQCPGVGVCGGVEVCVWRCDVRVLSVWRCVRVCV